ncbi:MAG TPA: allantoinase, partial [Candidatus Fraserbacteria bacterium]|nr:allantoinase [Candidatus Fraserbacteria bacterium]
MQRLSGGRVFIAGELQEADLFFDEQIRAIGSDPEFDAAEPLDVGGKIVLPGLIDVHVHFRDFRQAYQETWASGARAALQGGVTTVLEMPNSDPPTLTLKTLRAKRARAEAAGVRFGLYGGLTENNIELIPLLAPEVAAFKLYLGQTTG